jgi:hypothetical protein
MRERDSLKDLGAEGMIIMKWFFKDWCGDVNWFCPL